MSAVQALLNTKEAILNVFWYSVSATADGSGNVTVTFGTNLGTRNYFLKAKKGTGSSTSKGAYATPQYQNGQTIPPNKSQSIPLDLSDPADPTVAFFPLDGTQSLQFYVTGLDAGAAYTFSVGTNYNYGNC